MSWHPTMLTHTHRNMKELWNLLLNLFVPLCIGTKKKEREPLGIYWFPELICHKFWYEFKLSHNTFKLITLKQLYFCVWIEHTHVTISMLLGTLIVSSSVDSLKVVSKHMLHLFIYFTLFFDYFISRKDSVKANEISTGKPPSQT